MSSHLIRLHNYFRQTGGSFSLSQKYKLNFRELYLAPKFDTERNVIFLRKALNFFDLKDYLINDKDLVGRVKQDIINILELYVGNIKDIKLLIEDHPDDLTAPSGAAPKSGIGIKIIQEESMFPDINPNVEIASHFDTAEQLDNYCRSSKTMKDICESEDFWRLLIKKVYNFPYSHEYNYEKLYKDYLRYKSYQKDIDTGLPIETVATGDPDYPDQIQNVDLSNMSELIKFLIFEKALNRSHTGYYLSEIIYGLDQESAQQLIDFIRGGTTLEEYAAILDQVSASILEEDNPKVMEKFMQLDFGYQFDDEWKVKEVSDLIEEAAGYRLIDQLSDEMISAITHKLSHELTLQFMRHIERLGL